MAPYGLGPARVILTPPDDMDVQLGHQIADPGDVDPGVVSCPPEVIRDTLAIHQHSIALGYGQIQQIGQFRLGDQDEPGHLCIAVE